MRIADGMAIDQDLLWYRLYLKYLKCLSTNENYLEMENDNFNKVEGLTKGLQPEKTFN